MPKSHFFAYLARMKFIRRWGLMRNSVDENIMEHSLQVAMVAHALAVIRNRKFGGNVPADRVALMAVYHDCGEVITGDLATPIKTFNPRIKDAYRDIEKLASQRIHGMLPDGIRDDYESLFFPRQDESELWLLVKAADKICAYLKCQEELQAGNKGFLKAERAIRDALKNMDMPEVAYFIETFIPSFSLTLDELN